MLRKFCATLGVAVASLCATGHAAAQSAPFCVVSRGGTETCSYYDLSVCQSTAASVGGACVYRSQSRAQPNPVDGLAAGGVVAQQMMDAFERGRAARRVEQSAPYPAPSVADRKIDGVSYLFKCSRGDGSTFYSSTGYVGCTVVDVQIGP